MMPFREGQRFEEEFVVSEAEHSAFLNTFRDQNPLHSDPDFAVSKGFEGMVMHGNILNAFVSYFVGECLPDKNVILHSQEIRYRKPVYLGDTLSFVAKVSGTYESVKAIEFDFSFAKKDVAQTVAKGKFQIGLI